jgi:hypothetical protein
VLEQGSTGEEMQVRQTAQRKLAAHLKLPQRSRPRPPSGASPQPDGPSGQAFSLDLTGAALVEVNLELVSVV